MIADYATEVINNTAMTISFPTCINSTAMSNYLPVSTKYSFVSYYNAATWTSTAVTSLVPLAAYRFTWSDTDRYPAADQGYNVSGREILRIYLKNQSSCGPPGPTATVGVGYNFLASDGVMTSNNQDAAAIDSWLTTLDVLGDSTKDADAVSYIYNYSDAGDAGYSDSGGVGNDWDSDLWIYPYTGYWVYISGATGTTYPLGGRGKY